MSGGTGQRPSFARRVGGFLLTLVIACGVGYFRFRDQFLPALDAQGIQGVWENTGGDVDTFLTIAGDGTYRRSHPAGTIPEQVNFAGIPPRGKWRIDPDGTLNFLAPSGTAGFSCKPRGDDDTLVLKDVAGNRKVVKLHRKNSK